MTLLRALWKVHFFFFLFLFFLLKDQVVGGNELGEKKEHKSNGQSKMSKFYVRNSNREKSQSHTQFYYIIRKIIGE